MRVIKFYRTKTGNCPVEDFLQSLPDKQSKKVAWTLRVVRDLEQVPTQYLKKLKKHRCYLGSSGNAWKQHFSVVGIL